MWYNVCIIPWFSSLCMLRLNSFKFLQPSCLNEDTEGRVFVNATIVGNRETLFLLCDSGTFEWSSLSLVLVCIKFHFMVVWLFPFSSWLWNVPFRGKLEGEVQQFTKQNAVTITRPVPECTFLFLKGIPLRQDERNNVQCVKNNKNKLFIWTVSWHVLQMMYDAKQLWSPSLFTSHL